MLTDNQLSQLVTRAIAITRHGSGEKPLYDGPMMAVVLGRLIAQHPDAEKKGYHVADL